MASELTIRYSIGSTDPTRLFRPGTDLSIGGTISTNAIVQNPPSALKHNLFDVITGAQSSAGYTDYRIVYAHNASALTAFDFKVFIPRGGAPRNNPINYWGEDPATNTFDPDTDMGFCEMGVSPTVRANAVAAVLASETTAPPSDIVWGEPTPTAPLQLGDIAGSGFRAVYIKRTIPSGAVAWNDAEFDIAASADTGQ